MQKTKKLGKKRTTRTEEKFKDQEDQEGYKRDICTPMFIGASFTTVKIKEQRKKHGHTRRALY